MKKKFVLLFFLIYLAVYPIVDFSFGITNGGSYSYIFSPMNILDFIIESSSMVKSSAIDIPYRVGLNLELNLRFLQDLISISYENNTNFYMGYFRFNDINQYLRYGVGNESIFNFKVSVRKDVLKENFFIGFGNGSINYLSNYVINTVNSSIVITPATYNYILFNVGFEKFFRFFKVYHVNYHRYAVKIKPRLYGSMGINRNDLSFKFDMDSMKFKVYNSNLAIAGFPEVKIGFDFVVSSNLDLNTFRKDYQIKLSDFSKLIYLNEKFKFNDVKNYLLKVESRNIYSTYYSNEKIDDKKITELLNSRLKNNPDENSIYRVKIVIEKLDLTKIRGFNTIKLSLKSSIYVFRKDEKTNRNILMLEGILNPQYEINIQNKKYFTIYEILKDKEESFDNLLEELANCIKKDFLSIY